MSVPPPAVSDCFLADHQRLEGLLVQLLEALEANEDQTASELWAGCRSGLSNHIEVEEAHLFPGLLRQRPGDARVLVQEHRHIRMRLTELDAEMAGHVLKSGVVRDFIYEFRAHTRSENPLLYQWSDAHLDEAQRAAAVGALSASLRVAGGDPTQAPRPPSRPGHEELL